jgi:hypothetical protein
MERNRDDPNGEDPNSVGTRGGVTKKFGGKQDFLDIDIMEPNLIYFVFQDLGLV